MRFPFSLVLAFALSICAFSGCENNGGPIPMGGVTSTPSGTPEPTPTASQVIPPTATPVPSGTPTPTAAPSTTPTPTAKPTATPTPSPTATATAIACPAIALEAPQLAYPIPGATGVPASPGSLVFYGSLPSNYTGTLRAASGATIAIGSFGAPPSPLPSPIAPRNGTPGQGEGGAIQGVPYPQLAAATTYTISFSDTGSCAMTVTDASYTFTTR